MTTIGRVRELVRYPVKSMAGTPVVSAFLGLHGLAGDRRFAFRRQGDQSGFPFLTAGRFPELLTFRPTGCDDSQGEPLPTHVRTPAGENLDLRSDELRDEIARRSGHPVELMKFKNGLFDDAHISVITRSTIDAIGREAGVELDPRRMRANILLETDGDEPFAEDRWVGSTLFFGDADGAALAITSRDERCAMVNLDPDTGEQDPRIMKAIVRMTGNYAGVYAAVMREGTIHVGQSVQWERK